jgi:hypothetical protein
MCEAQMELVKEIRESCIIISFISCTLCQIQDCNLGRFCSMHASRDTMQGVPKPMSRTSPGYSPPLIKQKTKSSYQHGSKSEQGPRYPLYVHVRVSSEYYIRCSNDRGNEFASFPQTLRYARNCSAM